MPSQEYLRAVLRAVAVSTAKGKRPGRSVVLNAAAAALNISDRSGLSLALDELIEEGLVADRKSRLLLTEAGQDADTGLDPDAEKRMADHLAVTFKDNPDALDQDQQEILFLIAVADHFRRAVGIYTLAQAFNESIDRAQDRVDALVEGGYLVPHQIPLRGQLEIEPVTTYALTRAGQFELRRGDLRRDSIRYPEAQSERAKELVQIMSEVLSDE